MEVLHGGYDRDLEFGADPVIWQTESGSCKVSGIILSVAISVSDEFHVIIKNRCTDNELTLTGDIETLTYYVTDPEDQSVSIGHSDSVSGCTITYKLEFWDEAK